MSLAVYNAKTESDALSFRVGEGRGCQGQGDGDGGPGEGQRQEVKAKRTQSGAPCPTHFHPGFCRRHRESIPAVVLAPINLFLAYDIRKFHEKFSSCVQGGSSAPTTPEHEKKAQHTLLLQPSERQQKSEQDAARSQENVIQSRAASESLSHAPGSGQSSTVSIVRSTAKTLPGVPVDSAEAGGVDQAREDEESHEFTIEDEDSDSNEPLMVVAVPDDETQVGSDSTETFSPVTFIPATSPSLMGNGSGGRDQARHDLRPMPLLQLGHSPSCTPPLSVSRSESPSPSILGELPSSRRTLSPLKSLWPTSAKPTNTSSGTGAGAGVTGAWPAASPPPQAGPRLKELTERTKDLHV